MINFNLKKGNDFTKEQLDCKAKLENWSELLKYLILQDENMSEISVLVEEIEKLSEYTKKKVEQVQKNIIELLESTAPMVGESR